MRTLSPALFDSLKKTGTTLCKCWLMILEDETKIGFTDHDSAVTVDDVVYEPNNSFSASAVKSADNFSVDNLSVQGLTSDKIEEQLLRSGGYDNAKVEIFMVDWSNPKSGKIQLRGGYLGEVKLSQLGFEAELRASSQLLQQPVGRLCTIDCDVRQLGDSRCGVKVQPVAWTANTSVIGRATNDAKKGTVVRPTILNSFDYVCLDTGVTGAAEPLWPTVAGTVIADGSTTWLCTVASKRSGSLTAVYSKSYVEDRARTEATGWYNYGTLKFTSGVNEGVKVSVRSFGGFPKGFTFLEPLPNHPTEGDTYEVTRGCDRTWQTCKNVFNNVHNHRGHPHMPTETQALQTPEYTQS
jgi:hypothetical protein